MSIPTLYMGQSGFRFQFSDTVVYTDPYLTDHVANIDGPEMKRMVPACFEPHSVRDADWVLISHAHIDHCDLKTVLPLAQASPGCKFVCPNEVATILAGEGIEEHRLVPARETWLTLSSVVKVHPVPAAHTQVEWDKDGYLRFLGYVLDFEGRRIYHAGDTSPDEAILQALQKIGPIDVAILPVNERNYFRNLRGIIGNMSVREAFQMAQEIGAKVVVPMHWDMFAPNSVYREEIELVYSLMNPPFRMILEPQEI